MSAKTNLTIEQGATWDRTLTVKYDDTPLDLTDYDARMQIRKTHKSTPALVDLTVGDGAGGIVVVITYTN